MGIFDMFGGSDPSGDANKYLDQIPDTLKQYFQKYINAGNGSMNTLQGQYSDLLNDPGSLLSKIGKGYQKSPGFEFEKNQGLTGINNAAAAGGMLGTDQHQQQAGELSTNLANKDYNDYMQKALGLYGQGLSGEEGFEKQGFDASTGLGKMLSDLLSKQGQNAFNQGAADNQGISDFLGGLLGFGGKFAMNKIFPGYGDGSQKTQGR